MEEIAGPGFAPADLPPAPAPDPDAEPEGYLVEAEAAVRIHFLDWDGAVATWPPRPANAPGILLVHGLAGTAWTWAPVARRLRRAAHVVAMDLRGHGLSDAPTGPYGADRLAADAMAVAEGAGLSPVPVGAAVLPAGSRAPAPSLVVAGIGFGAIVAAWTARTLGGRCAGLVLVDGGWEDLGASSEESTDEWLASIEEPPEVLASMGAWLADRAGFDPATCDADQEQAARAQVVETAAGRVKLAVHPHVMRACVEAMLDYRPAEVLAEVEAPVTVLVAGNDGARRAALAELAARRASTGMAPIRAAEFPGRGHDLPRHEPDAIAAALLAGAGLG